MCVCNRKSTSQTINVCNWPVHRKCVMEALELHKRTPARKPCVTDVLCNWEMNPQIIKYVCVLILGPTVYVCVRWTLYVCHPWGGGVCGCALCVES